LKGVERVFGNIGAAELIIILVLALIIFGPGKLPEVGKAIGRSIREFKRAQSGLEDDENGTGGAKSPSEDKSGAGKSGE